MIKFFPQIWIEYHGSLLLQMVNVQEPGRGGAKGGPTSPTGGGGESVYMGLRDDTRQPDNGGNYACPDRK